MVSSGLETFSDVPNTSTATRRAKRDASNDVISQHPEINLVTVFEIDRVEHPACFNRLKNGVLIKVELPPFEMAEKGRGILRADRNDDIQMVRSPGLPLKTRSDRCGDHILDAVGIEYLNHEPESVERGH